MTLAEDLSRDLGTMSRRHFDELRDRRGEMIGALEDVTQDGLEVRIT